jgi:hypothetical protein
MMTTRTAALLGVALFLVSSFPVASATAGDGTWTGSGVLQLRSEWFETPYAGTGDRNYGMSHARLRGYLDYASGPWRAHAGAMGAASLGLPPAGAFGIGPVYTAANGGETEPGTVRLIELSVAYLGESLQARVGRQKYASGMETKTGIAYLDGVKARRIGERLIGNWDWVPVGRRFDGATLGGGTDQVWGHAFLLQPLAGGVNYREAYEWLDDLLVYGGSVELRHDAVIPRSSFQAFVYGYSDDRPGAQAATGGDRINLTTVGGTWITGSDRYDFLAWGAFQTGDWGAADHSAYAFFAEAGWKFLDAWAAPNLRGGFAQASGQDTGSDHTTFFNMLPTNHKWYGFMDYNAFQNLRTVYLELLGKPHADWSFRVAGHAFWLVERTDRWYQGAGAFNAGALGYAGRSPAGGVFTSANLGQEIDLSGDWTLAPGRKIQGGVSFFQGGAAAEEVFPTAADGTWAWLQFTIGI